MIQPPTSKARQAATEFCHRVGKQYPGLLRDPKFLQRVLDHMQPYRPDFDESMLQTAFEACVADGTVTLPVVVTEVATTTPQVVPLEETPATPVVVEIEREKTQNEVIQEMAEQGLENQCRRQAEALRAYFPNGTLNHKACEEIQQAFCKHPDGTVSWKHTLLLREALLRTMDRIERTKQNQK